MILEKTELTLDYSLYTKNSSWNAELTEKANSACNSAWQKIAREYSLT
jgi:hypothetical protein